MCVDFDLRCAIFCSLFLGLCVLCVAAYDHQVIDVFLSPIQSDKMASRLKTFKRQLDEAVGFNRIV